MQKDEIITEVWKIRDEYARKHRNDLDRILADMVNRQKHPFSKLIVRRKRRKPAARRRIARAAR